MTHFERLRLSGDDNIKTEYICSEDADWLRLFLDCIHWSATADTVIKFRCPIKAGWFIEGPRDCEARMKRQLMRFTHFYFLLILSNV